MYNISDFYDVLSAGTGMIYYVVMLAYYVFVMIGQFKLFAKAGKSPILAIIPVVNFIVLTKIVTGSGIKALWAIVPIANIVFYIKLNIQLARSYGYDVAMGILSIFFFPIACIIMGFSSNRYQRQY